MILITRSRRESAKLLRELELFKHCDERELVKLQSLMTKIDIAAGRVLTRADEQGHEFFIVSSGLAEVRRDGQLVATLGPGSFFGEMALLDGGVRTATVIAATPLEAYVLSEREFRELLASSPTVAHNMLRTLSQRLRRTA
jgi:CRP-like cAMP-binding protein